MSIDRSYEIRVEKLQARIAELEAENAQFVKGELVEFEGCPYCMKRETRIVQLEAVVEEIRLIANSDHTAAYDLRNDILAALEQSA